MPVTFAVFFDVEMNGSVLRDFAHLPRTPVSAARHAA